MISFNLSTHFFRSSFTVLVATGNNVDVQIDVICELKRGVSLIAVIGARVARCDDEALFNAL